MNQSPICTVGDIATDGKHFRNIHTKQVFFVRRRGDVVVLLPYGIGKRLPRDGWNDGDAPELANEAVPGVVVPSVRPCELVFTASAAAEHLLRRFDPFESVSDRVFSKAIDGIECSSMGSENSRNAALNALRAARDAYDIYQLRKCMDLIALVAELERNDTGADVTSAELTRTLFPNVNTPTCPACALLGEQCALCLSGVTVPPDMDALVAVELGSLLREGAHHAGYQRGERFPIDVAIRRARESCR